MSKGNFQKSPLWWAPSIFRLFITEFAHEVELSNFVACASLVRPVLAHSKLNPDFTCTARLECLTAVQTEDILFTLSGAIRWYTSLLGTFLHPTCAWDCLPLIVAAFAPCCKWLLVMQFILIGVWMCVMQFILIGGWMCVMQFILIGGWMSFILIGGWMWWLTSSPC